MTRNLDYRLSAHSPKVVSLFRVVVGLLFALHGSMILFDWPLAMPMKTNVGDWPGWWAGLIEFVTGLLVMVGLFTRPAAFLASGTMAVAYFWQHWPFPKGNPPFWPFFPTTPPDQPPNGNSGEFAILFCFSFLLILFIGPGVYAIDSRRRRPVGGTTAAGARPGLFDRFRRRPIADTSAAPAARRPGLLDRFRRR
jgi:putative oxidoreductase